MSYHRGGLSPDTYHGDDGEEDTKLLFVCGHCPKRYARKDYLERHVLNHNRPMSMCPACGKGFARPDVLRKHLSTSCKSRRGDDDGRSGIIVPPLTAEEEDALVPRKRRRTLRRPNDSFATASRPSASSPEVETGSMGNGSVDNGSLKNGSFDSVAFTAHSRTHAHVQSQSQTQSHAQAHQILSPTRLAKTVSPPQPLPRAGPARAGASLDMALAPAFAVTPETMAGFSFNPAATTAATSTLSRASANGGVNMVTGPSAGRPAAPRDDSDQSLGTSVAPMSWPPSLPVLERPISSLSARNGVNGNNGDHPGAWNPTNEAGDNMDDLLSWLFNIANNTGPPAPLWAGTATATIQDQSGYPDPLTNTVVMSEPVSDDMPLRFDTGSVTKGNNSGSVPVPMLERPSEVRSTRAPQPSHPYAMPNGPIFQPYPTFPEEWERNSAWKMPKAAEIINEDVRRQIIALFEGNLRDDLLSPAFNLQQMRLYFELYFIYFAPLYPIIHRPSLGYRRLPPDLLLTMLCIGTAFADDKEGFLIATRVHKRLRNRVFELVEEEPRAPLTSLQTILLINHFSRSYCSLRQHDVAQIFHSPSIIMARLSGVFLPSFTRPHVGQNPLDHWLEWVAVEERKRIGWFAFMMDTENSALFRHYLLVHCFSVQIDWPADDAAWAAEEPFAWSRALRSSSHPPSFRNALRELCGRGTISPNMSEINLWILLHGLISVSWTLLWRDLGDLSMIHESKITHWKDSLRRAFGSFRDYVGKMFAQRVAVDDLPLDMHVFWAGIPFAHLGCILLLSDTEQIRIFAGANNIAGRPISPAEWTVANTYVGAWARSQDGAYSCYAAVELLSQVFKWSHEARFLTAPSVIPWCLYIASLIIWAYSTVLDGPDRLIEPYILPVAPTNGPILVKIEPSLARRDAISYLARLGACSHPFDLPEVPGKNRCGGVVAYTAYLSGTLGRGIMDESRDVLMRLLTKDSRDRGHL